MMRRFLFVRYKLISVLSWLVLYRCHGRLFNRISLPWFRGGASPSHTQPTNNEQHGRGQQQRYHNQYNNQGLTPPDLPNYDNYERDERISRNDELRQHQNPQDYDQQRQQPNPSYGAHQQPGRYDHVQQQHSTPDLPHDTYDESSGQPPLPPDYNQHHHEQQYQPYPSLPDDPSIYLDDDLPEMPSMDSTFKDDDANDNRGNSGNGGMDLSEFDKQYILNGLARLYRKKILPLELSSRYGHFHSPPLSPADFVAPPQVLLLGQYSVGKTSFIKYLVGRDFPGIRVGPEPTTDRFTTVLWGPNDKIIPGAALCSQTDRPFTGLSPYGNNFLSRLEGVEADSPILQNVTLIDTPGILSGQKQRSRNYDYESVMKWFGERADLVIVMFDAHKLDISDELKRVMELFVPHLDKIRIVLNKADTVSTQQLMRVYGALMWSLGKVMNTPEVCRVYMGSFWDAPLKNTEQMDLLQQEETDLLNDIMNLPQQAVMRRINELVKRARSVKVHAYIIHYLRKQLPYTFGKREKQRRLIGRLESEFSAAARRYCLPKGDFPMVEPFRKALMEIKDLSEFPKLDKKLVKEMDKVFSVDIPNLLEKARCTK